MNCSNRRKLPVPKKVNKELKKIEKSEPFTFRVKLGEREIEIKESNKDVTATIEDLPKLIKNIHFPDFWKSC